jgi:cytoskeletal protein RodZ
MLIPGGILGLMAIVFLLATEARFIVPVVIILFGLLLLYRSLRRGRQQPHKLEQPIAPSSTVAATAEPESKRLPTLEEQIEAAIAEESVIEVEPAVEPSTTEKPLAPGDVPPGPEIPEPPEVPSPPDL